MLYAKYHYHLDNPLVQTLTHIISLSFMAQKYIKNSNLVCSSSKAVWENMGKGTTDRLTPFLWVDLSSKAASSTTARR